MIIDILSEACRQADSTGRIDVEALLSKPEVRWSTDTVS